MNIRNNSLSDVLIKLCLLEAANSSKISHSHVSFKDVSFTYTSPSNIWRSFAQRHKTLEKLKVSMEDSFNETLTLLGKHKHPSLTEVEISTMNAKLSTSAIVEFVQQTPKLKIMSAYSFARKFQPMSNEILESLINELGNNWKVERANDGIIIEKNSEVLLGKDKNILHE